ncbi:MAG TPA: hypothetical protein VGF77_08505 [Allosphingosinicella sp.]|jgi:hypothetical protein
MSGVAKAVGEIAGIIALFDPEPISKAILTAVAIAASITAAVTAKKPPAQGSTQNVTSGVNLPTPYAVGRTYNGGSMLFDVGYGGTVSGVPNPYSSTGLVWSLGPVEGIEAFQCDFATVSFSGGSASGYYGGFMHLATQLGACPEAAALAGPFGAIPNWGSASKLSGLCAGIWSNKFDKKGKIYASGLPQPGVILRGPKAYDPRQDSTYAGGSGSCRALVESTYIGGATAENPGCAAVTYALGRFQNGTKVFGPAFPVDALDWPAWVAFMNICDANGWKAGGILFEGPGISRWDNLKRLCAAGAALPCFSGGLLSVRYSAPKTALDTITADDLADGECAIAGMKTWENRLNAIVPKYKSEANNWDYVQSDEVSVSTYVTEDGEEKSEERQYDLCQSKDQAAQLAAYELVNGRELGPITLALKPRLLSYIMGEALTVDILEFGLVAQLCTIIGKSFDPLHGIVTLTLETETNAKHAFALGRSGTAPPSPALTTGEDMDGVVSGGSLALDASVATAIRSAYILATTDVLTGADVSGVGMITIADHIWDYPTLAAETAVTGGTITGLTLGTRYYVYFDDETLTATAPTYQASLTLGPASNSSDNPYRHYLGYVDLPAAGGGPSPGVGGGGGTGCPCAGMYLRTKARGLVTADQVAIGDDVWARHELTGIWGWYGVSAVQALADQPCVSYEVDGAIYETSESHLNWRNLGWRMSKSLPGARAIANATVYAITVDDAHTYELLASAEAAAGVLSHNKIMNPDE